MPGNLVDIYVKMIDTNEKVVYGELLEKIEILGVKDSSVNNVFESTEETRTPAYMYFSLPEAKYLLFSSLNYIKDYFNEYEIEVVLVPNTVDYKDSDATATEVTSDYLYKFIVDKISQIDKQKDLYTALVNEMEQLELQKKQQANNNNNKNNNNNTEKTN